MEHEQRYAIPLTGGRVRDGAPVRVCIPRTHTFYL